MNLYLEQIPGIEIKETSKKRSPKGNEKNLLLTQKGHSKKGV